MATTVERISNSRTYKFLGSNTDLALAGLVILILALMIVPLPPFMLDVLISANITFSIVLLMVAMYVTSPLELSSFPGLLLILTLFRLSLNVASARLILSQGYAGEVIHAFGSFVVQGNYVVGVIIFIILATIQFVVIIKGSGRIAEVTARFTLDAMPGKQMSIDADLNAGSINEQEAKQRRERIQREADFFGAMDGASKFVRGDAIAGIIIILVNVVGGFIIGMVQLDLSFQEALARYTLLTIGDGLVTQIPALVISTAAGMVVTRSASGNQLDVELKTQLFSRPKALYIAGGTLGFFAIIPGLPTVPFLALGSIMAAAGYMRSQVSTKEPDNAAVEAAAAQKKEEKIESYLQVDPIEVEIGYGLISMVDEEAGGDLFQRITNLRKQIALELGLIVPPIRVRDNLQLQPSKYVVKIRGVQVANGELYMDRYLAMSPSMKEGDLPGIFVTDPTFGLPAVWIEKSQRDNAEVLGFTVVEAPAVLSTHLNETLKKNADKIISRQEVKTLIDNLKKEYQALVDEINPDILPLGTIQKVLQNLLKERLPIRDLVTIIESLLDYSKVTKNTEVLTEYVRHALSETIAALYADPSGVIHAIALDPSVEQILTNSLQSQKEVTSTLGLSPEVTRAINESVSKNVEHVQTFGYDPVVICSATVRLYFYRLIHVNFPQVAVTSYTELPARTDIDIIGRIVAQ
ncbi:MAG: flagellar biosynthesis protein FlhA [Bacteroidetes bacterium]|nr:flagellar biosynthesis protein FlhA [Bacteroidota bacterium]MCL5738254.1 flagellar biosynthesis protein FlhA [Bacteroidota bacterium]